MGSGLPARADPGDAVRRLARLASGLAPLWLAALLLNLDALREMNEATERQTAPSFTVSP